jgi:hypothetical protein
MTFADVLTVTNIILSVTVVIFAVANYRRTAWFLYAVFALIFSGWTAVYVFVLLADPAQSQNTVFASTIIRPLNVATFGIIALTLWYRWRNHAER